MANLGNRCWWQEGRSWVPLTNSFFQSNHLSAKNIQKNIQHPTRILDFVRSKSLNQFRRRLFRWTVPQKTTEPSSLPQHPQHPQHHQPARLSNLTIAASQLLRVPPLACLDCLPVSAAPWRSHWTGSHCWMRPLLQICSGFWGFLSDKFVEEPLGVRKKR